MQRENLVRLLGRSFHEEWQLEHRAAEECLDRMLEVAPISQQCDGAAEIARILTGDLCENQIRDLLLFEVGCVYGFEDAGHDASSWLRHVHGRLLDRIATLERHPR